MEAGGRVKILPSPSLRKALNPIQERVIKVQGSENGHKGPVDWLPRTSSLSKGRIDKSLVDGWQIIKSRLKN
jgi:hypothetical protein